MKLLLDTHILLWSVLTPERLSAKVASALENPVHELWISPITTWEILVLAEKGRVVLKAEDPDHWIRDVLSAIPLKEARLNHDVAMASRQLNLPHQDPADRFIAATALVYDLVLVTADHRLMSLKQIAVMS